MAPFIAVFWKLLSCDTVDHGAWVCDDDLKFISALIDHEEGVKRVAVTI